MHDKSQSSRPIAKHISFDALLHYKVIIQFASERNFTNSEQLATLEEK